MSLPVVISLRAEQDVDMQYSWYLENADEETAERAPWTNPSGAWPATMTSVCSGISNPPNSRASAVSRRNALFKSTSSSTKSATPSVSSALCTVPAIFRNA